MLPRASCTRARPRKIKTTLSKVQFSTGAILARHEGLAGLFLLKLSSGDPGTHSDDAATVHGFAAQLGFRVPNMIISPFTRAHYVGHTPMDHTAVIKFVKNRFIGSSAHLTARDAAQPNLLDFFDFTNVPWATPPTPVTPQSLGYNPCTPTKMGP